MRKNKIVQVVFLYLMLLMCGCTTNTTDNSLMFGENGSPKIVIGDIQASKADIHSVLMKVLRERRWNVLDDGNPIVVEQLNGSQHAKLKIYIYSRKVVVDSIGSTRAGQPYVPLSYMEYIRKSLVRDLRMNEYERYNKI